MVIAIDLPKICKMLPLKTYNLRKTMYKFKIVLCSLAFSLFMAGCAEKNNALTIGDASISDELAFKLNPETWALLSSIDRKTGKRIGGDCSGFITVLNDRNDNIYFDSSELMEHMSGGGKSAGIYRLYAANNAISTENPRPGDLIFFYNTTSRTKNSKKKQITHIGVVRDVYKDGRVGFIHNTRGRNQLDYMNLKKNNTHRAGTKIENSYIVSCARGDSSCLSANRFAGFGKIAWKL